MKLASLLSLAASVAAHDHGGMMDSNSNSECSQRKAAFEYVGDQCENDADNYCSDYIPDRHGGDYRGQTDKETTAYQLASCMSQVTLSDTCMQAIEDKNLQPMLLCSSDILKLCSPKANTDKSSQIRCIRDNLSSFTQTCQTAISDNWKAQASDLNLPFTETPTDYDVYFMLSVPRTWEDKMKHKVWAIVAISCLALLSLFLLVCCIKCCKRKCRNNELSRAASAVPPCSRQQQIVAAPYTAQGNAPPGGMRLQTASPIFSAPREQEIYYAAPATYPASAPPHQAPQGHVVYRAPQQSIAYAQPVISYGNNV